jgi:hypothetical protein
MIAETATRSRRAVCISWLAVSTADHTREEVAVIARAGSMCASIRARKWSRRDRASSQMNDSKGLHKLPRNNTRKIRTATHISLRLDVRGRRNETCDAHVHRLIRGLARSSGSCSCSSRLCVISGSDGDQRDECRSSISSTRSSVEPPVSPCFSRTAATRGRWLRRDVCATRDAMD